VDTAETEHQGRVVHHHRVVSIRHMRANVDGLVILDVLLGHLTDSVRARCSSLVSLIIACALALVLPAVGIACQDEAHDECARRKATATVVADGCVIGQAKVKTDDAFVIGTESGTGINAGRVGALVCLDSTSGVTFKVGTGLKDNMRDNPPSPGTVITYKYCGHRELFCVGTA
jgi:hypothetical protein